jgi:phage terminase small subunit
VNGLNQRQKAFVREYIKTGIAYKSYMKAFGIDNQKSADTLAGRLLRKVEVEQAIEAFNNKQDDISVAEKAFLIREAHETGEKALKDKLYGVKLNSIDLKAKLNQVYTSDADQGKYASAITNIITQINISNNGDIPLDDQEVIDIPGDTE